MSGSGFDSDNESEKKPSTSRFSLPVPKKRKVVLIPWYMNTSRPCDSDWETPTAESSNETSGVDKPKETAVDSDFEVLCSNEAKIDGCTLGYQAMMSTLPGPDGKLQQPIFFMKPSRKPLDLKLPMNIERSERMEFAEAMIRGKLANLEYMRAGTTWSLQPGAQDIIRPPSLIRNSGYAYDYVDTRQLVRDYLEKNYPKKTLPENDEYYLEKAELATQVYIGLTYRPISLEKPLGKEALTALLKLCQFVVEEQLEKKGMGIGELCVGQCGVGMFNQGNLKLQIYSMGQCSNENAVGYLTKKKMWPKHCISNIETKVPDVQCVRYGSEERRFPITGVVKTSGEATTNYDGTLQRSLFEQTWVKALVGLRNSDVSYGVLLQPRGGTVLRLKVHEPSRKLETHKQSFDFYEVSDKAPFKIEEFMDFMKAIIGIFIEI